MWRDHADANVAELLLQHLFGLGTDVDRRHFHEHSEILAGSVLIHHGLHLREQLPQSFSARPMIVRVGHPYVRDQIGHHTLGGTMEDALSSNLRTHSTDNQGDSDSLFRWPLKLLLLVLAIPPPAVTARWTQAKTCLIEVVGPCPVQTPLVEDEAPGQQHLVRQSPHLGAASLCCSLLAEINADQESTHPFTRQFHLQSFFFCRRLGRGHA